MSKTYMSVNLGGKERGLKFNMNTLKYLGEITKNDPIQVSANLSDLQNAYKYIFAIVYSALLSNADSKKETPDFTKEEVEQWFGEMEGEEAYKIAVAYQLAFSLSGEEGKDTQRAATT